MLKIDAHQHFWHYDPVRHDWISEDMAVIRRDFLPEDLFPVLQKNKIDGCIAVQADQTEKETDFLLGLADKHQFIKGVVGWVDLQSAGIENRLQHYSQYPAFKGVRHILQGEAQRDLMLQPAFLNGIGQLEQYKFTYDILIFPDQLKFVPELAGRFPGIKFVIDHLAKPDIKGQDIQIWKQDLERVAQYQNVCCKISGMVTEASFNQWQQDDFVPYLDTVVSCFGVKRVMYGSDWPVCLAAATYAEVLGIVADYFHDFSSAEQELIFGDNAASFYNLA